MDLYSKQSKDTQLIKDSKKKTTKSYQTPLILPKSTFEHNLSYQRSNSQSGVFMIQSDIISPKLFIPLRSESSDKLTCKLSKFETNKSIINQTPK